MEDKLCEMLKEIMNDDKRRHLHAHLLSTAYEIPIPIIFILEGGSF